MKISKVELKEKYGIDIPKGVYSIKHNGNSYSIYSVQDDTSGCILLGQNKAVGKVINSTNTWTNFMKKHMLPCREKGEKVYITIQ